MIIGLFRVLYLVGPIMALALIIFPQRKMLGWGLWIFSAIIVVMHWVSFLSAKEDNATEVGLFGVAVWTPLLLTTLLATYFESKWLNKGADKQVTRIIVAAVCMLPSIIAFTFTRIS